MYPEQTQVVYHRTTLTRIEEDSFAIAFNQQRQPMFGKKWTAN